MENIIRSSDAATGHCSNSSKDPPTDHPTPPTEQDPDPLLASIVDENERPALPELKKKKKNNKNRGGKKQALKKAELLPKESNSGEQDSAAAAGGQLPPSGIFPRSSTTMAPFSCAVSPAAPLLYSPVRKNGMCSSPVRRGAPATRLAQEPPRTSEEVPDIEDLFLSLVSTSPNKSAVFHPVENSVAGFVPPGEAAFPRPEEEGPSSEGHAAALGGAGRTGRKIKKQAPPPGGGKGKRSASCAEEVDHCAEVDHVDDRPGSDVDEEPLGKVEKEAGEPVLPPPSSARTASCVEEPGEGVCAKRSDSSAKEDHPPAGEDSPKDSPAGEEDWGAPEDSPVPEEPATSFNLSSDLGQVSSDLASVLTMGGIFGVSADESAADEESPVVVVVDNDEFCRTEPSSAGPAPTALVEDVSVEGAEDRPMSTSRGAVTTKDVVLAGAAKSKKKKRKDPSKDEEDRLLEEAIREAAAAIMRKESGADGKKTRRRKTLAEIRQENLTKRREEREKVNEDEQRKRQVKSGGGYVEA